MVNLMLKSKRIQKGLDESEAAKLAHMTKRDYIDIENNMVGPKLKDMIAISNVFSATIDEIFNE